MALQDITHAIRERHDCTGETALAAGEHRPIIREGRIFAIDNDRNLGHIGKPQFSPQLGLTVWRKERASLIENPLFVQASVEHGTSMRN
jgi:hypothetical protein